jgi:hypothetical protein
VLCQVQGCYQAAAFEHAHKGIKRDSDELVVIRSFLFSPGLAVARLEVGFLQTEIRKSD